jgi:hypothetical protein
MDGWMNGWILRRHRRTHMGMQLAGIERAGMKTWRQAGTHTYTQACTVRHSTHAGIANYAHNATLRALDGYRALPRVSHIPQSGNQRTGAHLQCESVDCAAGSSGVEVDVTVDRVPVTPSRVRSSQAFLFRAQTAPVGLVCDDGRALARLVVVETQKGPRAASAVWAQREGCNGKATEATSANRGPRTV